VRLCKGCAASPSTHLFQAGCWVYRHRGAASHCRPIPGGAACGVSPLWRSRLVWGRHVNFDAAIRPFFRCRRASIVAPHPLRQSQPLPSPDPTRPELGRHGALIHPAQHARRVAPALGHPQGRRAPTQHVRRIAGARLHVKTPQCMV
jgi:hypothetical protein